MTTNPRYEQEVIKAVQEVVQMVFSETPGVEKSSPETADKGHQVIASIGLSGPISSSLVVAASESVSCHLVSKMLGSDVAPQSQDMIDGMGELANIIGGLVKTKLTTEADTINLSLPTVVCGASDLTVHHWIKSEVLWLSVRMQQAAFTVLFSYALSPVTNPNTSKSGTQGKTISSQDAADNLKKLLGS